MGVDLNDKTAENVRALTEEDHLSVHLRSLDLSPGAVDWLRGLWRIIQAFDDYADGDDVSRERLDEVIYGSLVGLPSNPFYLENQAWLIPAMSQATLKWMASDIAERSGEADARSYMWRAGFYDVVMLCVALEHGPSSERAYHALRLYGETVEDYLSEFRRTN